MKVLNIPTNGVRREGINSMQLRWTREMDKTGLQLDIAAVHNNAQDVIDDYKSLGCRVFELPDRQEEIFAYCKELNKLLRKEKYDAIHVHGSSGMLGIELALAKFAGIPVRIVHSRNTMCDHRSLDKLLRPVMYACMTKGLACSSAAGEWLFGNRPFEVMHNGLNTELFKFDARKRQEARKALGLDSSLVVGFAGNIKEQKNPLFLVDIIAELVKRDLNIKLLVVGDGAMMKQMQDKVDDLALSDNVIFVGRSNEVPKYMAAMDAFLFPSLYEGFGNVALEAQLSGLPVFVSNTVPADCKITDQVVFLPITDGAELWAESILRVGAIDDATRLARYDVVCQRMKEEHFDVHENASRLRTLYVGGKK